MTQLDLFGEVGFCSHREKVPSVKMMRCRGCYHLDFDYLDDRREKCEEGEHFCGLHGRARVDPDGVQINLDHMGGCGYCPLVVPHGQKPVGKKISKRELRSTGERVLGDAIQLTLFDLL